MTIQLHKDGDLIITASREDLDAIEILAKTHPKAVFDCWKAKHEIQIRLNHVPTENFLAALAKIET